MRFLLAIAALAMAIVPLAADAADMTRNGITVSEAWARETPGGSTNGAVYLTIKADQGTSDTLVSVSTPAAQRAELHTHIMDGTIMRMRKIESVPIQASTSRQLVPSGDHIMLFDLKAPLKAEETMELVLVFAKAGDIKIDVPIRTMGWVAPAVLQPSTQHHHH